MMEQVYRCIFGNCGTKICNWSAHFAIGVGRDGGGGA